MPRLSRLSGIVGKLSTNSIASYCGGKRGRGSGTVGSLSLPHMYPVLEMDGVACGNAPLASSRRYVRNMFCLDGLGGEALLHGRDSLSVADSVM